MRPTALRYEVNSRLLLACLALISICLLPVFALAPPPSTGDPLPSWNDGAAKQAIVDCVKTTTDQSSPNFEGLPNTKVGTFTQDLYDDAKKDGWVVISMKNDWKRIFAFDGAP